MNRRADLRAALDRQKVLSHTAFVRFKQPLRHRIDAEHLTPLIEQDQPLLHAAGDLCELIVSALQLGKLQIDLAPLLIDSAKEWRQLLIGIVFQRVLQIQIFQRRDHPSCNPFGQKR